MKQIAPDDASVRAGIGIERPPQHTEGIRVAAAIRDIRLFKSLQEQLAHTEAPRQCV